MNQVTTRSDLERLGLDALDKDRAGAVAISRSAGGVTFASAIEVMEFAKLMAVADKAVPKHLRSNPGACLRIVFQAVEWQMSPWAVADKSYEVNDRIAYESQLIHAVIEARAPLSHMLECVYEGEGPERVCIVTGRFRNGDSREYRSPKFKDIRPKNSPLWTSDPDQQHWYFSSRSWARKWCPNVLMGLYTREELQADPMAGRDGENVIDGSGLQQRLAGSEVNRDEGHRDGHAASELDQIATTADVQKPMVGKPEQLRQADVPTEITKPKNASEYTQYVSQWMIAETTKAGLEARWKKERKMRNDCGITAEELEPVLELYEHRKDQLSESK